MLIQVGVAPWLSALIVTVIVGAVAGMLALVGKKEIQTAGPPTPDQAIQTSREDVDYVKERARRR